MDVIVLDGNDIPNPEDMAMVQATSHATSHAPRSSN